MPARDRLARLALGAALLATSAALGAAPSAATPSPATPSAAKASAATASERASGSTGSTRGLVAGRATAIGDSVMIDYASALQHDLPGTKVEAEVSRQWSTGVSLVEALRSEDNLGSTVIVDLGTNGPVSHAAFQALMTQLGGLSRIVFVNVFVDRPWQGTVNATLRWGVSRHRNARIADWAALAGTHRSWLYPDGTHLPIGGPGALALAALVTRVAQAP